MSNNSVTFEGNIVRDPEIQFGKTTNNSFTRNAIAVTRSKKVGDEWEEETSFFDFSILDERLAENFCDTFQKGDRVIISGRMEQRTVENDDGEKRSFYSVIVDICGPSLKWATATIQRNEKKGGTTGSSTPSSSDPFDEL